jgi:hypothetical protein
MASVARPTLGAGIPTPLLKAEVGDTRFRPYGVGSVRLRLGDQKARDDYTRECRARAAGHRSLIRIRRTWDREDHLAIDLGLRQKEHPGIHASHHLGGHGCVLLDRDHGEGDAAVAGQLKRLSLRAVLRRRATRVRRRHEKRKDG